MKTLISGIEKEYKEIKRQIELKKIPLADKTNGDLILFLQIIPLSFFPVGHRMVIPNG